MTASWLIEKPSAPTQWDDEFEGTSLDPKWTRIGTFSSVAALDPLDTTSGTTHFESLNSHRKSWLMAQAAPSNTTHTEGYEQNISALPSECFIWCRTSISTRRTTNSSGDGQSSLCLYDSVTGINQNRLIGGFTGSGRSLGFISVVAGVSTNLGVVGDFLGESCPIEYMGIQKLTNTYHCWVSTFSGNWIWAGSATFAVGLDRARLSFANNSNASPGRLISGFDFFRVLAQRKLP